MRRTFSQTIDLDTLKSAAAALCALRSSHSDVSRALDEHMNVPRLTFMDTITIRSKLQNYFVCVELERQPPSQPGPRWSQGLARWPGQRQRSLFHVAIVMQRLVLKEVIMLQHKARKLALERTLHAL